MLRDNRDIIKRLAQDGFRLVSVRGSHRQVGWNKDQEMAMPHYIALIHKDTDGCYGVSFPDIPGVITGGDTIDEAMQQAVEVLQFAAEDWTNPDGSSGFKPPSTIDELRNDPDFLEDAKDAVVAFVEFPARAHAAE